MKLSKYKRLIIRCVVLVWFLLVFVVYYVTFFDKVIFGRSTQIGILGALVDFFSR